MAGANNVLIQTSAGSGGVGTIIINGTADGGGAVDLNWNAEASLQIIADRNIEVHAGARIRSVDSDSAIILTANDGGAATGNFVGIDIEGDGANPTLETVASAIELTGTGGSTGSNNQGVVIGSTSTVTLLAAGFSGIVIIGTGGEGTVSTANGVEIINGSIVRSTGSSGVAITGTGGLNLTGGTSKGVVIAGTGSLVDQVGSTGSIGITGTGGSSATGINIGLEINVGTIQSSGGNITIQADSTSPATVTTQGMALQTTTSNITATGTAAIAINANGGIGPTSANHQGLISAGTISSLGGNIGITASGGPVSGGTTGAGIELNGTISTTTGNITINGSAFTQDSSGIFLNNANGRIITTSGTIDLTADGGTSAFDFDNANSTQTPFVGGATAGNITFNVDSVDLGTVGTVQGSNNISFIPPTNANGVGIGGTGSGGLRLRTNEIARLADGFTLITVGGPNVTGFGEIGAGTFTDPVTLRGGTVDLAGALVMGTNDLTVLANTFTFSSGSITTTSGNIFLGPQSTTATLGLGTGTGTVNIANGFLSGLASTSGTFQFGRTVADSGDNVIDVNTTAVFADPISFFGRSVTVSGALGAGSSNVDFSISQTTNGEFTLDNAITTSGTVTVTGATSNNSTFDINQTGQTITLAGGASGTNTLEAPNGTNAWLVSSNNGGTMTGGGTFAFSNIQNMTGGTMNDTFTFLDGITIAGALNGGSSGTNTLTLSSYTSAVSVSLLNSTATGVTGGFSNLTAFVGPTGQSNNLAGPNASSWTITGADNAGSVDGTSFVNFPNLTGGTSDDTFTFVQNFFVTGTIDGGSGGTNNLDFSAHTNPTNFNLQTSTGPGPGFTFTNISGVTGSATSLNTLTGGNQDTNWNVILDDTGSLDAGPVAFFTNFGNLTGGTASDTFIFADGTDLTGAIDGGSTGSPPTNTLNYFSFPSATVNFNPGTESGTASNITGGFTQIQVVTNLAPPTPPSPPPAPLSSTSTTATSAIFAGATTASDFYGSGSQGSLSFTGLMGPAADNVTSMIGFIMQFPSLILGTGDDEE